MIKFDIFVIFPRTSEIMFIASPASREIGPFHLEMAIFPIEKHQNKCIKCSKYYMVPIGI
jgi:hypothetical protein